MKKSILIFNTVMLVFYSSLTAANSETRQSGKIFGQGTEKIKLELSEPRGGWTVNRMIEVSGTISDETASP
ncbi:hypothetical protein, partial [Klebsiella pneumoniae]|uniref:hypothetical protein n=1 Tax=Klebsiella pneumoniae TaxID=573 RepID=UPI0025A01ED2